MEKQIVADTYIKIPLSCPNTEANWGSIDREEKRSLLGNMAYVKKVNGVKIIVSKTPESINNWFFHIRDFIEDTKSDPVNIPIQTFDPNNLTI